MATKQPSFKYFVNSSYSSRYITLLLFPSSVGSEYYIIKSSKNINIELCVSNPINLANSDPSNILQKKKCVLQRNFYAIFSLAKVNLSTCYNKKKEKQGNIFLF
jgi:hypothetical protein